MATRPDKASRLDPNWVNLVACCFAHRLRASGGIVAFARAKFCLGPRPCHIGGRGPRDAGNTRELFLCNPGVNCEHMARYQSWTISLPAVVAPDVAHGFVVDFVVVPAAVSNIQAFETATAAKIIRCHCPRGVVSGAVGDRAGGPRQDSKLHLPRLLPELPCTYRRLWVRATSTTKLMTCSY